MGRRKLIGLITAVPESNHAQRVVEGICRQCEKYGYSVAVFAPMSHFSGDNKDYINGEVNIYELINFELLDGVIVDSISLSENNDETVKNQMSQMLREKCKKPVVSLNVPLGNYPVVSSNDRLVFRQIMEHVIDVHGVKEICFLTGHENNIVSGERLEYCFEVMKERGLTIKPEWVVYGDFWYTSGTALAKRIVSGEIDKPEAVVCASDHMAIGLIRYLTEHGVRVPEDIIVTGFEATQEAALNQVSVTSFESNEAKTAADAVDAICKVIEPEKEVRPFETTDMKHMHAGMSCGCAPDFMHSAMAFKDSFYFMSRDYSIQNDNVDIGQLLEGYLTEILTETGDAQECMKHIYLNTYYLRPYSKYYLCLKEDWLDPDKVIVRGYPKRMKIVVHNTMAPGTGFYQEEKTISFETRLMLPQMFEEDEPSVYYFSPVHFRDKMLGYSVIQRSLSERKKLNVVYRNWLRNINTALEMIQTKSKLMQLSISDEMTGAYNRRGMDVHLKRMMENVKKGDSLLVAVVDMDGLKYVNDTFGHGEGDYGIKQVHKALLMCAGPEEICVRAGGDEFYLFGVGKYTEEDMDRHVKEFQAYIDKVNETSGKPYVVSASIGMELALIEDDLKVDNVINSADVKMYASKVERKKQRQ